MSSAPPPVAKALAASGAEPVLSEVRALILDVARDTGTAPLTETLKWGQPAYLPAKKDGTTIRLGESAGRPAIFVHCQTSLVETYRDRFPTGFVYDGNRAVLLPESEDIDWEALGQMIALALTYHRRKRAP